METMSEARLMKVGVTAELLISLFTSGNEIRVATCVTGLPHGSKIRDVYWDAQTVWLIVEHASFPIVADGDDVPLQEVSYWSADAS